MEAGRKHLYLFGVLIVVAMSLHLFSTAFAVHNNKEAFSKMQKFAEQGKIPVYVIERGTYKYVECTRSDHIKGRNVYSPMKFLRSDS